MYINAAVLQRIFQDGGLLCCSVGLADGFMNPGQIPGLDHQTKTSESYRYNTPDMSLQSPQKTVSPLNTPPLRIVWIRRVGTSTDAGARLIQSQHRHLVRELYKKFYPCPAAHRLPSSITRRSASSLRRQASLIRAHSSLS